MGLTDKEKNAALFCARRADMCTDEGLLVVSRGDVLDMFDEFLSRIRDEQEAVAEIALWPDDRTRIGLDWLIDDLPPEGTKLFTTLPAAQCDCEELVVALQEAHTQVKELCDCHNHPYPLASFERYDEALANHAKRMKEKE